MSFATEIAAARGHMAAGELDAAMLHLERAHVIGQLLVWPHVLSHWLMLKVELRRGRPLAVLGQLVRIVLGALGSAVGVVPTGNTGGSDISMFERLPVAPELQQQIEARPRGRYTLPLVLALVALLVLAGTLAGCAVPPAQQADCGPRQFDAFLARFMTDRQFALAHTVLPLETLDAVAQTKSMVTREELAKAPLLADYIRTHQLSTSQVATPGALQLHVFRPDADSHVYYYRFRQQNGCWYLWQVEDSSL